MNTMNLRMSLQPDIVSVNVDCSENFNTFLNEKKHNAHFYFVYLREETQRGFGPLSDLRLTDTEVPALQN